MKDDLTGSMKFGLLLFDMCKATFHDGDFLVARICNPQRRIGGGRKAGGEI